MKTTRFNKQQQLTEYQRKLPVLELLRLTFVHVNLLYPGEGVDLHQRVRNADHMHPIHDTLTSEHRTHARSGLVHR